MSGNRSSDAALVLAVGLVVAAMILSYGLGDVAEAPRYVEVKGFAEREASADLAVWPIHFNSAAGTLERLRQRLDRNTEAVVAFLKLNGFGDAEITRNPPRVTDRWLNMPENQRPAERYTAELTLTLRTTRVEATRQAMANAIDLIGQGVTLTPNWGAQAEFLFTRLSEIKPEMVAEATADARRAAARFAEDSSSEVGAIRRARQGLFTIENLDPSSPHIKRIRVVTTIEYELR